MQDWSCSLPYCARAVAARAEAVVGLDIASFVYHGLHLLLAGPTVILFIIGSRACMHAQLTNAAGRCSCSRQVLLCTCTCLPLCNVPLQIDYGQLWSKQKASSRCLKHDRRPVDQAVQPELGLHMSPGCVLQLRCPHLGPTERRTTRSGAVRARLRGCIRRKETPRRNKGMNGFFIHESPPFLPCLLEYPPIIGSC